MQIPMADIERISSDLDCLSPWCFEQLVFLDEVSLDNQGILQRRGYGEI
jgi:hypothetical protein